MAFLSSFHEKSPLFFKECTTAQWQKGRNYGFECFVRCQKARWRFGRGELTEQVTVLHVPLMPFSAEKFRNELVTLKRPETVFEI